MEKFMTFQGHMKNGVVHLDDGVTLPEGAAVRVELTLARSNAPATEETPTLYDSLEPFIGKAEGLPADMSINLDHYLYGTPKRA
ncbi:MAG TPA: hypothetical protein DDY78_21655 [Planctomycetales bacterium]|nr:hypothetical protein [Planctomycetales bacterium]